MTLTQNILRNLVLVNGIILTFIGLFIAVAAVVIPDPQTSMFFLGLLSCLIGLISTCFIHVKYNTSANK